MKRSVWSVLLLMLMSVRCCWGCTPGDAWPASSKVIEPTPSVFTSDVNAPAAASMFASASSFGPGWMCQVILQLGALACGLATPAGTSWYSRPAPVQSLQCVTSVAVSAWRDGGGYWRIACYAFQRFVLQLQDRIGCVPDGDLDLVGRRLRLLGRGALAGGRPRAWGGRVLVADQCRKYPQPRRSAVQ